MLVNILPSSLEWTYKIMIRAKRYAQITEKQNFGDISPDITTELEMLKGWGHYISSSLPKASMKKLRIRYPNITIPGKEVFIEDGTIRINDKIMRVGEYYPISYQGKEYLVHKSDENIIEIIELVK